MLKLVVVAAELVATLDLERPQALPHHQAHSPGPRVLRNPLHLQACRHRLQQVFNHLLLLGCNPLLRRARGPQIQRIGTVQAQINPRIQAARSRAELRRSSEHSSSNKVTSKAQSVEQVR